MALKNFKMASDLQFFLRIDRTKKFTSEKSAKVLKAPGSFEKLEMQELPNLRNKQFVEFTIF
jgi:hypothetical protein